MTAATKPSSPPGHHDHRGALFVDPGSGGRDLPHLAGLIFGAPLMIARLKLDTVLGVLRPRLFGGDLPSSDGHAAEPPPYLVTPTGVAVIPVFGTLVNRSFGLSALSGLTSYQQLAVNLALAEDDPTVLGILFIADPARVEARVHLAVRDAIALTSGTEVELFLDADPLRPLPATLASASYEAEMTPSGVMSYRLNAAFSGEAAQLPRIGLQGTAKVYGMPAPLALVLFRRPLATLRQTLGQ
ncbi:hypothetical protein WCLP8_4850003 [uncultured Gammaproteobacteria bacterium]